jgi:hypothetical protein
MSSAPVQLENFQAAPTDHSQKVHFRLFLDKFPAFSDVFDLAHFAEFFKIKPCHARF